MATPQAITIDIDLQSLLEHLPEFDRSSVGSLSPLSSLPPSPSPSPVIPPHDPSHEPNTLELTAPTPTEDGPMHSNASDLTAGQRGERQKKKSHTRRKATRQKAKAAKKLEELTARPQARRKYVKASSSIDVEMDASNFPASSDGYIAVGDCGGRRVFKIQELVGPKSKHGLKLVDWDGITPTPLRDKKGRIIAILAGRPADPTWTDVHRQAAEEIKACRPLCHLTKKDKRHRRGQFAALACGITIGPGAKRPHVLAQHPANEAVFKRLFEHQSFVRFAGFSSGVFSSWMPEQFNHYARCRDALLERYPDLRPNFPESPWAAATVNFGPKTACFRHLDRNNLAFGCCSIIALGDFDPAAGGHAILWECGVVVTFPPGSTIIIPSACVSHSNTTIQSHETRYSFTQYSAGGPFRFVERNFQQNDAFRASLNEEERAVEEEKDQRRLEWGLSLFSTIEDLRKM